MGFAEVRKVTSVINVVCFIGVMVMGAVFLLKPIRAVHRGFFCDDESIRYPYHENTVSVSVLVFTTFLPVLLMVSTLEVLYGVLTARFRSGNDRSTDDKFSRCEGLKTGLARAGLLVACLIYGNILCYILTEVFKISFGRLRPSFLSACIPETDLTSFPNCTGLYVEDVTCLDPDESRVIDMRKSFVSGHASFAVFNMLFIILYFQLRLPSSTPRLVVSLLQSVAFGYAVFVCSTRIYDNFHHPTDVLGGTTLGIVTCWVTIFKICPRFVRHPPRSELELLPTTSNAKQGTSPAPTSVQTKE